MKTKYIAIPEETLNKWFILLNMSGKNTKQAVAREIDDVLEANADKVHERQMQAKINDNNELEV